MNTTRDSLFPLLRRPFVRWYMRRIAGRYCPCEWPIKSKRLMHLCGRIDDAYERESFRDFCGWVLEDRGLTSTSSTSVTAKITNLRVWRRGN